MMRPNPLSTLSPTTLVMASAAGLGAAVFAALLGHESAGATVLGRYTPRYAAALVAFAVLAAVWAAALARRGAVVAVLARLSRGASAALVAALCALMIGLTWAPVEPLLREAAAFHGLWACALLVSVRPADFGSARFRFALNTAGALLCALGAAALAVRALTAFPFSPDEAHWADYALTAAQTGHLYARTWLQEPTRVLPGLGWSVAAYGHVLNTALDLRTGRVWMLAGYAIAIAGIGTAAGVLYGRAAGWRAAAFALLSAAFLAVFDYRPHHQLPAAAAWALVCAAVPRAHAWRTGPPAANLSRIATGPLARSGLHFACGLLITGAMQLHAAAIAFAVGFSLFYAAETVWVLARRGANRPEAVRAQGAAVLAFALGAAVGTGLYWAFNIAPVGGLGAYLANLTAERGGDARVFAFVRWPSLLEGALIVCAGVFALVRGRPADRFLTAITACVLAALAVFDTQGYLSPAAAFYAVAVGGLSAAHPAGRLLAVCAIAALLGTAALADVRESAAAVRILAETGAPEPYLPALVGEAAAAWLRPGDVPVSTHLLIWGWPPDAPPLISTAAEVTAARRWALEPAAVWARVGPTVVYEIPAWMTVNPGLRAYLDARGFRVCRERTFTLPTQSAVLVEWRAACG
jgi:hypothetical protein